MQYRSKGTRDISRGQVIVACDVQSLGACNTSSQNESQNWRRSDPYVKQTGDRQLVALLASRVAASVLLGLVSTHTTELILIRDQRSVVSTAQSITITIIIRRACLNGYVQGEMSKSPKQALLMDGCQGTDAVTRPDLCQLHSDSPSSERYNLLMPSRPRCLICFHWGIRQQGSRSLDMCHVQRIGINNWRTWTQVHGTWILSHYFFNSMAGLHVNFNFL